MLDVEIEGISYLQTFRSELDSELRRKSLEDVIERLNSEANQQQVAEEV